MKPVESVLCGGEVHYTINQKARVVTAKFINTARVQLCEQCQFNEFCKVIFTEAAAEPAPQLPQNTITVKAFTGMSIGSLPIIKETSKVIDVHTKNGQLLRFDRQTGIQLNCANPKFANRIEPSPNPVTALRPFQKGENKQ